MRFSSVATILATMVGVTVAAPVDAPGGPVDVRSASEMLTAKEMERVRSIISGSNAFQSAVEKRENAEREIPIYIIFTYAE